MTTSYIEYRAVDEDGNLMWGVSGPTHSPQSIILHADARRYAFIYPEYSVETRKPPPRNENRYAEN